jgi:tRNA uridine 5-carboxymethylaminomethyl modification enzyme
MGEPPAEELSKSLESLGFELGRLKTGTTPRLDKKTIDFSKCRVQPGDDPPMPFSFDTEKITQEQVVCWISRTNETTHDAIRSGLDRSPLYTGVIDGIGPRYCPSIEDKVVRFPDRTSHQIFLEPEGRSANEIYPNGISTSLPLDVQEKMVRSIPGLENARILKPGYAIEYDFVNPIQLKPTLETRGLPGLFHAGQINGTSGYEEAAAQGLVAGINAVQKVKGEEPLILDRSRAYIGVLIDDLITKGVDEPYRMFTSRAEYRLLLREDNADLRLRETGRRLGLILDERWERFTRKRDMIEREVERLESTRVVPGKKINDLFESAGSSPLQNPSTLALLLKRPELRYSFIDDFMPGDLDGGLPPEVIEEVEIMLKYEGYIKRERESVKRFQRLEGQPIPEGFVYDDLPGMSIEIQEKLKKVRPASLGQALRIPGVTPAAIAVLQVHLKARGNGESA